MISRRSALIGSAPVAVVIAAWVLVVLVPDRAADRELGQRQEIAEQALASAGARVEEAVTTERLAASLRSAMTSLDRAVPRELDVAGFVRSAHTAAANAGVVIAQISPQPVADEPSGSTTSLDVNLTLKGSYAEMLFFIDEISRTQRLVLIDSLTVQSSGSGYALDAELALRIFANQDASNPTPSLDDDPSTLAFTDEAAPTDASRLVPLEEES